MARIIYGVAGEGYGHSSRSHLIAQRLIDAGHTVMFAASNKSLSYLRQYYGDSVKEIFGLTFNYKDGQVNPLETLKHNVKETPHGFNLDHKLFRDHFEPFDPDLVITDFEPFSAWWALARKVPFISIDNIHALTHLKLDRLPDNLLNRFDATLLTRAYYFKAVRYLIFSFFNAAPKKDSVVICPPVLRPQVLALTPSSGRHIVIYTTTAAHEGELLAMLNQFPSEQFYVYGFEKYADHGHVLFKERSTEGFLADLASCRGIVASAGFSLLSECMYLRKKMLLMPVPGQYEQIVNAYYVQKLGLGVASEQLTETAIKEYLACLDKPMPDSDEIIWPDNEKFFEIFKRVLAELDKPINI